MGMKIIKAIAVVALCGASVPVSAQDFLMPLQDMVDQFTQGTPKREPAPRRVDVAPKEAAGTADEPPVPRPRPPSLPDVPAVDMPTLPTAPQGGETAAPPAPAAVEDPAPSALEDNEAVEPTSPVEAPAPPVTEAPAAPDRVYQVACPAVIAGLVEAEIAPPLDDGICGEQSPLVVTGVMSRGRMVELSSPVTTNCEMASALPGWVDDVDGYAQAMLQSPLAAITTGTSYMCRARNSDESQFTSEHGFANALDVVGFTLEDGRNIEVTGNWLPADKPEGRLLRLAHDAACGGFMTVLGPEANAEHNDHLHLDMGCHGKACEARICQ